MTLYTWSKIVFLIVGFKQFVFAEREHKVHNIVLYPEKHSWCQTTPIQQVVSSPGYESVTIDNHVCVGACFSYSIPKTQPAEPGELIGPYCDSCQPTEIKCFYVNLKSENKILKKRVEIISNCSCTTCAKEQNGCDVAEETTAELPWNMFTSKNLTNHFNSTESDIPDLLSIPTHHKHIDANLLNVKTLYEKYRNESRNTDQNEDTSSEDESHTVLPMALFDDPQNQNNDPDAKANIERIFSNFHPEDSQPEIIDLKDSSENAILDEEIETKLLPSTPLQPEPTPVVQTSHPMPEGPKHHHFGEKLEVEGTLEHLIKGPHGSLVLEPIQAKIHVDTDTLKPNDEGVILTYENH